MKKHPPHPPKRELKEKRVYSESYRKARVADIENGMLTVLETHRVYGISISVIYRWIHRYSTHLVHHTRQVVELESEQHRTKMLLERVGMLERTVGQKQLEIDVLRTMLDLAGQELGDEWKKKLSSIPSHGFTTTGLNTGIR
jgi:transposase